MEAAVYHTFVKKLGLKKFSAYQRYQRYLLASEMSRFLFLNALRENENMVALK